jgi:hypothetical protein
MLLSRNAVIVVATLVMAAVQNPECPQYIADKKERNQGVQN